MLLKKYLLYIKHNILRLLWLISLPKECKSTFVKRLAVFDFFNDQFLSNVTLDQMQLLYCENEYISVWCHSDTISLLIF